jgi:transcriptional regulator GlxA family with amidase domain
MPEPRVAVVLTPDAPLFETAVPLSVFGIDRSDDGVPRFETLVAGASPGAVPTTAGLTVAAPYDLAVLPTAGLVIVPTWPDPHRAPDADLVEALRSAYDAGAIVLGLCLGTFVLAAAGLLDGRRATTHWRHTALLAERYPQIEVDAAALYVDEGQVVTSAGTAAGLDACLHVVRREHGAEAAAAIARRMVVAPHRAGGQSQFIRPPDDEAAGRFAEVLEWATKHLGESLGVDDLQHRAGLSRRSFDRRFREEVGTSPLQWLLHQRILAAQRLLESTSLSVDEIAGRCGFSTAVSLRPQFRRIVGTSPRAYREAFHTTS